MNLRQVKICESESEENILNILKTLGENKIHHHKKNNLSVGRASGPNVLFFQAKKQYSIICK